MCVCVSVWCELGDRERSLTPPGPLAVCVSAPYRVPKFHADSATEECLAELEDLICFVNDVLEEAADPGGEGSVLSSMGPRRAASRPTR